MAGRAMTQIYATVVYDDGRRVNSKWVGDPHGVRVYAQASGVRLIHAWPGASVSQRNERGVGYVITLAGIDDPQPFTLEHWGGCHCGSALKRFRAPTSWEPEAVSA
jgi:hypothetical protein